MNEDEIEFNKKTRKVFHDIHVEQNKDDAIYNRLVALLSTDYLGVEKDYFNGKICLDAGCGSNANGAFAILSLGAKKVHAFDLDESFIPTARERLKPFEEKFELSPDNVLHTKFEDNKFDFIHCSGVLHHTGKPVIAGLNELSRILKPGGQLYFMVLGVGGLLHEFNYVLRRKYRTDEKFKSLIDNLDEIQIRKFILSIVSSMMDHNDDLIKSFSGKTAMILENLFDKDLALTIKDRIQAPVYTESSEFELREWLEENGFKDIRRLKRYPKYSNVRRFLAPLYYEYNSQWARLFYGEGLIQIIATKI